MHRPILMPALLGACLALFAGGLAAQAPATGGDSSAKSTSPQTSTAQPQSAAQPGAAATHAKTRRSSHHAAKAASTQHVAGTKPAHGTKAKTKTKAEASLAPDETAYRQALRGCVTQRDQSQRDSCIDDTIQKFGRNA